MSVPFGSGRSEKPIWPTGYVRTELDRGPFCPKCDSTQMWPWGFLGKLFRATPLGCINRECELFYLRPRPPKASGIAAEVARAESNDLPGSRKDAANREADIDPSAQPSVLAEPKNIGGL